MASSRSRHVLAMESLVSSMIFEPMVDTMGIMNLASGCLVATMDKILSSGMTAEISSVSAVSEVSTTSEIAPEHCLAESVSCLPSSRWISKSF